MLKNIQDFLTTSLLGNIIGILSLLTGVVGLFYTIITYAKTKMIERKIPEIKVDTANRIAFQEFRSTTITYLNTMTVSIQNAKSLSRHVCEGIYYTCKRIGTYSAILSKDDKTIIDGLCSQAYSLLIDKKYKEDNSAAELLGIAAEAIGILERGEYAA